MARKPKPKPTIKINLMAQSWRSIAQAVKRDGHERCAESIRVCVDDARNTQMPEGLIRKVYEACLNHDLGVGAKIAQAADSHWQKQGRKFERPRSCARRWRTLGKS